MADFTELPDLASRLLGGSVVDANDEFFAARDNLVNTGPPTFTPQTFGAKGQVYDGWETRRRREPGYDHAVVRLGAPGIISGVVVDTAFFTGNFPPFVSVQACGLEGYPGPEELTAADWIPIVPRSAVRGDTVNSFPVRDPHRFTHVRLVLHPDGGVARLRVHGSVVPDPRLFPDGHVDLAAAEYGGQVTDASNRFYGSPQQLVAPGLARVMGEGWETARRRDGGNDWVRVRLVAPGRVRLVELDTSHFKGNAPAAASLRGVDTRVSDPTDERAWFDLLPRVPLQPDTRHRFPLTDAGTATEVRLDIFPDGGMARLRLPGRVAPDDLVALRRHWWESLPPAQRRQVDSFAGPGGRPGRSPETPWRGSLPPAGPA
ncbi:allantoicase [Micromonospora sp. NPDC050397]|uniref:allantoicase n=1 Tax=Micromonospora sp. NPDC050397 TaxID=3364279 RepID=UPI00384F01B0